MTGCSLCKHYRRTQLGPTFWEIDCASSQVSFPHSLDCAFFKPPTLAESGSETGLGYIWDNEYEGPA